VPKSDREVYQYFADNELTLQEVDYLAYASFAVAKFDWFDKFIDTHGREPTQDEINAWISELPDSRLDEIHDTARRVFRSAAREYMAEQMKAAEKRAVDTSILAEIVRHNKQTTDYVRSKMSFWRNLFPNIGIGFVSSVIFAVVIILASLIFTRDPSPIALYKSATQPAPAKGSP
jgi:hypothetical protein